MSNLDYKVYRRPRGKNRVMVASFIDRVDAVNFGHHHKNTLDHTNREDYGVTVVFANRVIHKVWT